MRIYLDSRNFVQENLCENGFLILAKFLTLNYPSERTCKNIVLKMWIASLYNLSQMREQTVGWKLGDQAFNTRFNIILK